MTPGGRRAQPTFRRNLRALRSVIVDVRPFRASLRQVSPCTICCVRSRTLLLLVLLACALVVVPSGTAKPRDGIPAWVGASATRTLTHVFGNPTIVANWNIPYPRKVVVVWEFQSITVCRTCSAPSNEARPKGRVVRVSFDRRSHRLTGEMRFCEVHGITPPLSACLAR
jgi:hypothetical protein